MKREPTPPPSSHEDEPPVEPIKVPEKKAKAKVEPKKKLPTPPPESESEEAPVEEVEVP